MAKIEIYARLRPTKNRFSGIKTSHSHVSVQIGREASQVDAPRFAKAPGARHDFKFCRAFDESSSQGDVFETVARKIVDRFVEGYNGTIFAYGQTSTGKTYTVEGTARQYEERGLIPRTLSYLYGILQEKKSAFATQNVAQNTSQDDSLSLDEKEEGTAESWEVKVHISYMEIYQNTGFDLLNPGTRPGSLMLTLPKVQISEGADGRVVVRDLSIHEAANEEVAMSLLFQGSTCRKVAETAMNQSSSRSHSIFTITMTTKQPGSEVILRSKLHLVDLAGSERVSKTGSDGRILQEAKFINLSLHHLEHVIVSLQQQSRSGRGTGHIPYRNSMLTMVLRGSLGGNCLTAMIATVSAEEGNICETISTLRFSQRVACISNTASRNEELDDKAVIKKLRKRVSELERELTSLRETKHLPPSMVGCDSIIPDGSKVSENDRQFCHKVLYDFFHGRITNPVEAGINTPALFQECLCLLRNIVIDAVKSSTSGQSDDIVVPLRGAVSPRPCQNGSILKNKFSLANGLNGKEGVVAIESANGHIATETTTSGAVKDGGSTGPFSHRRHTKRRKSKTPKQDSYSTDNLPKYNGHQPSSDTIRYKSLHSSETPPHDALNTGASDKSISSSGKRKNLMETSRDNISASFSGLHALKLSPVSPLHTHRGALSPPSHPHTSHPHTSHSHAPSSILTPPATSNRITPSPLSPVSHHHSSTPSNYHTPSSSLTPPTSHQTTSSPLSHPHSSTPSHPHTPSSSLSHPPSLYTTSSPTAHPHSSTPSHPHTPSSSLAPPTPTSRLSSGIGSLKGEEEDSEFEPAKLPAETQPLIWATRIITHSHTLPTEKSGRDSLISGGAAANHARRRRRSDAPVLGGVSNIHEVLVEKSIDHSPIKEKEIVSREVLQSFCCSPAKERKVVSPETRGRLTVEEKGERSQVLERKQELASNVHFLSLKVEEEQLRAQLETMGERLASQHARILACQHQQQTGSESRTQYDLAAEKIAEQQLRIKQARLHQRLLTVQQELNLSSHNTRQNPVPKSPTSITIATKVSPSPALTETHHKGHHTKVEHEIERLRECEVEKQLELREAATRRKIQELKQQFTQSPITPQSVIQPRTHTLVPGNGNVPHTSPSKEPQLKYETSSPTLGEECTKASKQSEESLKGPYRCQRTSKRIQNKLKSESFAMSGMYKCKAGHTNDSFTSKQLEENATLTTEQANELIQTPKLSVKQVEVSERVYLKGVSQQNERVARIRRCIAAATTIQSAWRAHRDKYQMTVI